MPEGYHQLTRDKRCQIYTLKARGDAVATIANEIEVHRSTIYREIERNGGRRGYRYKQANEKAVKRRCNASNQKQKMTSFIIFVIRKKLKLQWSPEQISGWLKKEGYSKAVSYETIYQYIWRDKQKGGVLYKELRHHGKNTISEAKGQQVEDLFLGG